MGGTGKTPHTEYIVNLLKDDVELALLSRGYGRATKGTRIAKQNETASSIGDEPFQIFEKFPEIKLVVDGNRRRGIQELIKQHPETNCIVMDDGFQHKAVQASLYILLCDYQRPYFKDYFFPSGTLRDQRKSANSADVIIVSKCPKNLNEKDKANFIQQINPSKNQKIYFTEINYQKLKPLNEKASDLLSQKNGNINNEILSISAIAEPSTYINYLKENFKFGKHLSFSDHYVFKATDYQNMNRELGILSQDAVLIMTEKDASKFKVEQVKNFAVFSLPIAVDFKNNKAEFDQVIQKHVRKN